MGFIISGEYVDNGLSGAKDRHQHLDRLTDAARKSWAWEEQTLLFIVLFGRRG